MGKSGIPYGHQSISWIDAFRVGKSVLGDWLTMGPAVEEFENSLSSISHSKHAVAVSSGSAALHCAYAAIELGPGDEIITSALTFASTATTALNLGARVVFADTQADTGNIDPTCVEALVSPKTKAVVAVDYAGHPADLEELLRITRKNGLVLIEDGAHSLGSTYREQPIGSLADMTTFSFFPTKNITTGEGGAVVTSNGEFARKARLFRSHGIVRNPASFFDRTEGPWHQEVQSLGLNYRLPDILASLGSSQLLRLSRLKAKRRKVWDLYLANLPEVSSLRLPAERDYVDSMWHLYPLRVQKEQRRNVFEHLRSDGINVQVNYIPVYWHPVFQELGYPRGINKNSENYYLSEISMPMHPKIGTKDMSRIVSSLSRAVSG